MTEARAKWRRRTSSSAPKAMIWRLYPPPPRPRSWCISDLWRQRFTEKENNSNSASEFEKFHIDINDLRARKAKILHLGGLAKQVWPWLLRTNQQRDWRVSLHSCVEVADILDIPLHDEEYQHFGLSSPVQVFELFHGRRMLFNLWLSSHRDLTTQPLAHHLMFRSLIDRKSDTSTHGGTDT